MVVTTKYNAEIAEYYRQSAWLYKCFWYSKKSLGMNYGFWKSDTKNLDEAILNHFQYLVDKAKIKQGMRVLDAGCGVGGGAVYIAKQTGAKAIGITVTKEQIPEAQRNARNNGVADLVEFRLMDYTHTTFPDNYFDVVFGVESICYANPKTTFLKEAYRILRLGGVVIVSDGYCIRKPKNNQEKLLLRRFCEGWKLAKLEDLSVMTESFKKVGFKSIVVEDMTRAVKPSFRWIQTMASWTRPLVALAKYWTWPPLKYLIGNIVALEMSVVGVEDGLGGHFTHIAKK